MARVDDVQGYRRKFENQKDRLDEADIDERDRKEIRRWVAHLRTNDNDVESLGTVVGHLNRIRLSAERGQMPLVEFESVDDVNGFQLYLEDVVGLSGGTIRNYMKAIRKFFLWLHGDNSWADEISIGAPIEREHDPSENIAADEFRDMLEACKAFDVVARDRAMIALLRDTGLRIGAVLSLQMKHVNLETARGTLKINTEANVKGASGEKPVTWSRAHVSNWLDQHPRPQDDEAPLLHKIGNWDPDDPDDDGALDQTYAARRISKISEEAGLDPERVHAHLFRGTAISEWIVDDVSTPKIEHRVDWVEGSEQRKVYQRVEDEQFNEAIHDHYGVGDPDESEQAEYALDITECPVCENVLSGTEPHCPQCGARIESSADMSLEDVNPALREYLVEEDDRSKRVAAADAADELSADPDLTRLLLEELMERV